MWHQTDEKTFVCPSHKCGPVSAGLTGAISSSNFQWGNNGLAKTSSWFPKHLLGAAAGIELVKAAVSRFVFTETTEQLCQSNNIPSLLASGWMNTVNPEVKDFHSPLPSLLSHAVPSCHCS